MVCFTFVSGAGLDTTYFWVADFWASPKAIFYEIDFLEVLSKKVALFTRLATWMSWFSLM